MTNAGGMRAVRYGVTRDYVLGMQVVLPDGEITELGGKIVKNSSGYSLLDLLIGSEGTLGILTRVTLKLISEPRVNLSLLVPFADLDQHIAAARNHNGALVLAQGADRVGHANGLVVAVNIIHACQPP